MNSDITTNTLKLSSVTPVKIESSSKGDSGVQPLNSNEDAAQKAAEVKSAEVVSLDSVKKAADHGNTMLQSVNLSLQFKVDDSTKDVVVKIVDNETGKTVRQIPSEEMLAFIKRMQELDSKQKGAVIQDRA
jgi:flagellar protein FlaG